MDTEQTLSLDELFGGLSEENPEAQNPFKFLDPYGPEDKNIYFGRDLEIAELYSKFYKSRLIVVYGESGSGKTSLIQCGLKSEIPSEDALFIQLRSAFDPLESLRNILKQEVFSSEKMPENLGDALQEACLRKGKSLVLVLDQFEELFLFLSQTVRSLFIESLAEWFEKGINIRVILGIREDFLARLTEMEGKLPQLYDNRLWVRRMSREQAEEVITAPCKQCNVEIEAELVAALLCDLTQGEKGVELPILQVVLDMLYRRAMEKDSENPRITYQAYNELGKVQNILGAFVEERVEAFEDPEPVRQVLKAMVTTEATRRICSIAEIQKHSRNLGQEIEKETLTLLLRRLVDERILREDPESPLFELRHDALAKTIYQWMTGIEQELMEVRETLEHRFKEYQQSHLLLQQDILEYIAPYESRLFLSGEIGEFVALSKKERQKQKQKKLLIISSLATLAFVVVSFLGLLSFNYYLDAKEKQQVAEASKQLAEQKKQEAEIATKRAEKQRDVAVRAVKKVIYEIPTRFSNILHPQIKPLLSKIAEENLSLLEEIIALNPDAHDALREKGTALTKFGDLWLTLGQVKKSLQSYSKGLEILRELSRTKASQSSQHDLAIALERTGSLYLRVGKIKRGELLYQEALQIRHILAQNGEEEAQRNLSVSLNKRGNLYLVLGKVKKAQRAYLNALSIRRNLAYNGLNRSQRDLFVSLIKMGNFYLRTEQASKAQKFYSEALKNAQDRARSKKDEIAPQQDLAFAFENRGRFFMKTQQLKKANDAYSEAMKIRDKLATDGSATAKRNLSNVQGALGWNLILLKKWKEAQKVLALAFKENSQNYAWAVNLGHASLLLGDFKTAHAFYEQTLALLKTERQLRTGPIADFKLFLKKGWKIEESQKEMQWMLKAFSNKGNLQSP